MLRAWGKLTFFFLERRAVPCIAFCRRVTNARGVSELRKSSRPAWRAPCLHKNEPVQGHGTLPARRRRDGKRPEL